MTNWGATAFRIHRADGGAKTAETRFDVSGENVSAAKGQPPGRTCVSKQPTTIFVCTVCRQGDDADSRPGQRFFEALRERLANDGAISIAVEPVECLAVCKRPCTVAFAGAEKWTYVIGDLDVGDHLDEIVAAAKGYAATTNGIVAWKERPACFRKGVVSRTPPLSLCASKG
jgi:predicted metal-binding protein